jgi:hypothetical protein
MTRLAQGAFEGPAGAEVGTRGGVRMNPTGGQAGTGPDAQRRERARVSSGTGLPAGLGRGGFGNLMG